MKHPGRIKAISFDGDMTLWDFQKVMRHSLGVALKELRRRVPGDRTAGLSVETMIEIRNSVAKELKGSVTNLEEVRLHAFRRTLEVIGCPDESLAADLNALYLKHRFEDIELYPDVIPCLDAIPSGLRVGLLSNGNGYPERCGLSGRFSFVMFSQDVGFEKPDARIFRVACRKAECEPRELLHIGDSLENDVAGANGVGAVSVWLNRNRSGNDTGIVPEFEIGSLAELIGVAQLKDSRG